MSARRTPMIIVEALGQLGAEPHRFLRMLDGGGQLTLPLRGSREHLFSPDAQAR